MTSKILYVFDNNSNIEKFITYIKKTDINIALCPITTDFIFIDKIIKEIKSLTAKKPNLIEFSKIYHEKAFSVREDYIRFISDFSDRKLFNDKNIKSFLKYPGQEMSMWWLSLISEKNTIKSDSFSKLVKFLSIVDIQKNDSFEKIIIDISDADLCNTIARFFKQKKISIEFLPTFLKASKTPFFKNFFMNLLYLFHLFNNIILVKIKMGGMKKRKKILEANEKLFITYFPVLDETAIINEKYVNKYIEPIQIALENKGNPISWVTLIVNAKGYTKQRTINLGKQINDWGYNFFFIEEWLEIKDFILIFFNYIHIWMKYQLNKKNISENFNFIYKNELTNLWDIFEKDWNNSFSGKTVIQGIFFTQLFLRLLKKIKKQTLIIYIAELHAWEKALCYAAKKEKIQKIIGIQHTGVALLLLNHFYYKKELNYGDNINTMPKPDYLACVGKITKELFLNSGWDKKRLFILGAVRFQHFKKHLENIPIPWKEREQKIVVTPSIDPNETIELIKFVSQAFANEKNCKILIKGHPSNPVEPLIKKEGVDLNPNIFEITDMPLYNLLPTAKALIVTESSSGLEALACQCPVIIPHLTYNIDMNPLSEISDLPFYVTSPKELKEVSDKILSADESPISYEKCREFIKNYLDILDSNEEFIDRIKNLE